VNYRNALATGTVELANQEVRRKQGIGGGGGCSTGKLMGLYWLGVAVRCPTDIPFCRLLNSRTSGGVIRAPVSPSTAFYLIAPSQQFCTTGVPKPYQGAFGNVEPGLPVKRQALGSHLL
jgi:hypothetical protein